MGRTMTFVPPKSHHARRSNTNGKVRSYRKGTEMNMFLGTDGGFLGVGAPEIALIVLVGYFVLGPSELYKLTKDIGKFFQNIRTLSSEATKSFESTMENQLDLNELRKAQVELNQAFNFRRSINIDDTSEAFSEPPVGMKESAIAGVASSAATATMSEGGKMKKRRRVKKKKAVSSDENDMNYYNTIPDLDMSTEFEEDFRNQMGITRKEAAVDYDDDISLDDTMFNNDLAAQVRKDRIERLKASGVSSTSSSSSPEEDNNASQRFASQLNAEEWNKRIMENEDKLSPLAQVMQRLAILEEERLAANQRLDEEFQKRADIEDMYYQEKRKVLEEAAAQISMSVNTSTSSKEKA